LKKISKAQVAACRRDSRIDDKSTSKKRFGSLEDIQRRCHPLCRDSEPQDILAQRPTQHGND